MKKGYRKFKNLPKGQGIKIILLIIACMIVLAIILNWTLRL